MTAKHVQHSSSFSVSDPDPCSKHPFTLDEAQRAWLREQVQFLARRLHVGIVRTLWHQPLVDQLEKGARLFFEREAGIPSHHIARLDVPGTYELPYGALKMIQALPTPHRCVVCVGVVLRGETIHDRLILQSVFPALIDLSIRYHTPVSAGIIAAETWEQAAVRAQDPAIHPEQNKGWEAALASLYALLRQPRFFKGDRQP